MEAVHPLPRRVSVLIVDDEPLFAEMIQALLASEEDIEVLAVAPDGRAAVRLTEELRPDVVIMDVSMPVMDGIEATRRIRQADPHACVLILTGAITAEDVDRARQAGASAYITKDRISTDLIDEIRNLGGR